MSLATIIKNVVRFTNLVVGTPVSMPHELKINGVALAPRIVLPSQGGITLVATTTQLTATRTADGPAAVDVYVETWHTIENLLPTNQLVGLTPLVVQPGTGGGGGGGGAVDFTNDPTNTSIASVRAADQAATDPALAQITNFGSNDGAYNPGATGATAKGVTISGGDDNTASGQYAIVLGGAGNTASGDFSIAGGNGAEASNYGAVAIGSDGPIASGQWAVALGEGEASGNDSFAAGGSTASGGYATAFGNGSNAIGPNSFAAGNGPSAEGDSSVALGNGCTASGTDSFAACTGAEAFGNSSFAVNYGYAPGNGGAALNSGSAGGQNSFSCNQSQTTARDAFAYGNSGSATRESQASYGAGQLSAAGLHWGDAQTSLLVLRGLTPGGGINETTALKFGHVAGPGTLEISLEDNRAYAFHVSAVVGGIQGGSRYARTIELDFVARRTAGVTTIAASGAGESFGDAATDTWAIAPSVGAGPDRIILTFTTGAGAASACKVAAKVEFTEVEF